MGEGQRERRLESGRGKEREWGMEREGGGGRRHRQREREEEWMERDRGRESGREGVGMEKGCRERGRPMEGGGRLQREKWCGGVGGGGGTLYIGKVRHAEMAFFPTLFLFSLCYKITNAP